jgi:glycosyltransferase involved in cell wall biosynthesis
MTPVYKIGVILPHCKLFGGVKRFFALGEIFIRHGHQMFVFTPDGIPPDWFEFSGKVDRLSNLDKYKLTLLFITEPAYLTHLLNAESKLKIFYHVMPKTNISEVLKHKEIFIFSNSTNMYMHDKKKYGINSIKAIGGAHVPDHAKEIKYGQNPFVIMCYGRLSRKRKGTAIVVKAAEALHKKGLPVKLLLFDSPLDNKGRMQIKKFKPKIPFEFIIDHPVKENEELFKKANVFVAVEKNAGWSNTAAEALAYGVPLIASNSGTKDFLINNETGLKVWRHPLFVKRAIEKIIADVPLQQKLAANGRKKIKELSWENLAGFILNFIEANSGEIKRSFIYKGEAKYQHLPT